MIKFSKFLWLYFVISAIVLVPGMYTLVRFGLKQSIDFAGGTLLELRVNKAILESDIRTVANTQAIEIGSVAKSGESSYILRMKSESQEKACGIIHEYCVTIWCEDFYRTK